MTIQTTSRVDRTIESARSVLDRLDEGTSLSELLPSARMVAELAADKQHLHWLDFEIYGADGVPGQTTPLQSAAEKAGFVLFWKLHATEDPADITVDSVLNQQRKGPFERTQLLPDSIATIEDSVAEYVPPDDRLRAVRPDDALRVYVGHRTRKGILNGVRAYVHRFASQTWSNAMEEKENAALLGPDYRFVMGSLAALDTEVGKQLESAIRLIKSQSDADWAMAALQCRNVILMLGRNLYSSDEATYYSARQGKTFDLKGDKEKNRLHACVEEAAAKTAMSDAELDRLRQLVDEVYTIGSKGKAGRMRQSEARKTVVDTFDLVASLDGATGLDPI